MALFVPSSLYLFSPPAAEKGGKLALFVPSSLYLFSPPEKGAKLALFVPSSLYIFIPHGLCGGRWQTMSRLAMLRRGSACHSLPFAAEDWPFFGHVQLRITLTVVIVL